MVDSAVGCFIYLQDFKKCVYGRMWKKNHTSLPSVKSNKIIKRYKRTNKIILLFLLIENSYTYH